MITKEVLLYAQKKKLRTLLTTITVLFAWTIIVVQAYGQMPKGQTYHHGHSGGNPVNYDSVFNAAQPLSEAEAGRTLIDECLAAYGGLDHLNSLKSIRFTWEMKTIMTPDSVEVVKSVQFDRHYKIERERPDGIERRILSGDSSWFQGRDTVITLTGGRYKAELFSYTVLSLPKAFVTEDWSEVRYATRPGDDYQYIYLKKNDSLLVMVGIDPEDKLIKVAEGAIEQDSSYFSFINTFDDYRKEEGFLFPHKLVNISMGLKVGESTLLKVDINPEFDENEFKPKRAAHKS